MEHLLKGNEQIRGVLPSAIITGPGEWDRYSSGSSRLRHGGVDCLLRWGWDEYSGGGGVEYPRSVYLERGGSLN